MSRTNSLEFQFDCMQLPEPSSQPAGLRLGIQEKDAVMQDVAIDAGEATFRFAVNLVLDDSGEPEDFRGSYVHGPRGGRFIYLCWGQRTAEAWESRSRAKVPLAMVGKAAIASAIERNAPIKARIRMTDAKGRPAVATLKPDAVAWPDAF